LSFFFEFFKEPTGNMKELQKKRSSKLMVVNSLIQFFEFFFNLNPG
jgi:hypothetical protein